MVFTPSIGNKDVLAVNYKEVHHDVETSDVILLVGSETTISAYSKPSCVIGQRRDLNSTLFYPQASLVVLPD